MFHTYSELYLSDTQTVLTSAIDYALNDCKFSADAFSMIFYMLNAGKQFEIGNPSYVSGRSGVELVRDSAQ